MKTLAVELVQKIRSFWFVVDFEEMTFASLQFAMELVQTLPFFFFFVVAVVVVLSVVVAILS